MKNLIQLVTSFLLSAIASCTLSVKNQPTTINHASDTLTFPLSYLFNLGAAINPTFSILGQGQIFYPTTNIASKDISQYMFQDQGDVVNFVNNKTFFAIYDNANIVIQDINLDKQGFGALTVTNFGLPGASVECTDLEANEALGRIYVACQPINSTPQDPGAVFILELDEAAGTLLNTVVINLDQDHIVAHRLQISIVPMWPQDPKGQVQTFVVVYDQGLSSGLSTTNKWAIILSNAQSGNLIFSGFGDLTALGLISFSNIYDMFPYQNQLLITGRTVYNGQLTMGYCGFNVVSQGNIAFNCSANTHASLYSTSTGYIGIWNTGQYVEINTDPSVPANQLLAICNFGGSWTDGNFLSTDNCAAMPSYVLPTGVFISRVEGSDYLVVVKYVHADSSYAGYSLHNFGLKTEESDISDMSPHVVPFGKALIMADHNDFNITWQVPPYYYLSVNDLTTVDAPTLIRVQAQDDNTTTPVYATVNVTKMGSIYSLVSLNQQNIPDFNIYEGTDLWFSLNTEEIQGNALTYTMNFDSTSQPYTNYTIYDTTQVGIAWSFVKAVDTFLSVHFSGQYAVVFDTNKMLAVFECDFASITQLVCTEKAALSLIADDVNISVHIEEIFTWVMAWGTDQSKTHTFVYVWDGQTTITKFTYNGIATAVDFSEINGNAYVALAFNTAMNQVVQGYMMYETNPYQQLAIPTIDQGLSSEQYFCPMNLKFDPENTRMLWVYSFCPNQDQRIIRYQYPPTISSKGQLIAPLVNTLPINFVWTNVAFCPLGTEVIIGGSSNGNPISFYSSNLYSDRNNWNFGLNELNLGNIIKMSCGARQAGLFTAWSNFNTSTYALTVFWGNQQYNANHKVYKIISNGISQYNGAYSFEFRKNAIHVLTKSDGSMSYYMTYVKPIVDISFFSGFTNANATMNLKVANQGMNRGTLVKPIQVTTPYTNLTATSVQKINGNPPVGKLNLETYTKFQGPMLNAHLRGVGPHQLTLQNRIWYMDKYTPDLTNQHTFDHLENNGFLVAGVHTSQSNSSIFTMFTNINNFAGTFQPAHGVQAFNIAALTSNPNAFFIAYSTAEATNNTLQFLVLLNGSLMAIGQQPNQVANYTRIRVEWLNNDAFLVVGCNEQTGDYAVYSATYLNGQITSQLIETETGVSGIATANVNNSQTINVMWTLQNDPFDVYMTLYSRQSGLRVSSKRYNLNEVQNLEAPFGNHFAIESIECKADTNTSFFCLLNTNSINIFEMCFDYQAGLTTTNTYSKVPGYNGKFMSANERHFIHMVHTYRFPYSVMYVAYQRFANGGSQYPYYTQENDMQRPFALTTCPHGKSHFQMTTSFPTAPLYFLVVSPMTLNVIDANANFTAAIVEITSASNLNPLDLSIADIIDGGVGPNPDGSTLKWWPFVLIIAILIVIAIAFIVYKSQHDAEATTDDPDKYVSLKPEHAKESAATDEV